jgi:hypothetical protein
VGDGFVLVVDGVGEGLVLVVDGVGEGLALVVDGVGVGLIGGAQAGTVMTSSSRVTAPLLARARPSMVSPAFTVIDARARMLPRKVELAPSVAEDPTCQKTLQAWAPLVREMSLAESVPSVEPTWKMKTEFGSPWPLRVRPPPTSSEDVALYTPGSRVWPAPMKLGTPAVGARRDASLYAAARPD